jgi:hypothetical protein
MWDNHTAFMALNTRLGSSSYLPKPVRLRKYRASEFRIRGAKMEAIR